MTFAEKLDAAIQRNASLLCLGLDPNPEMLPPPGNPPSNSLERALGNWLKAVIERTKTLVCAYKPSLGFYLALGTEGLELLAEVLSCIPSDIPIILDAKHGDLNTASQLSKTFFERWRVDAVTVNPYVGQESVTPFLLFPDRAVFVLTHTSNPSAEAIQSYPTPDMPLYLEVVKAVRGWGSADRLGLEVGTAAPSVLRQIRAIAPERTILARSIWSESTDLKAILEAGLNQTGTGLLLPVPQDWLGQPDLAQRVGALRQDISTLREQLSQGPSICELLPQRQQPSLDLHQALIVQLFDIGCLMFGNYVQASGAVFPYYIDLRRIISNPQLFHQVLEAYAVLSAPLEFDRIAGIPYGSLPTATGLSLKLNRPMIYPRKEVKAHGTRRLVEGHFESGETALVIDDVLITGKSVLEGIQKLETSGLRVSDIVVLIDHEGGVRDKMRAQGYQAHAVFTLSEISRTLYETQRITEAQYGAIA
ncbi:bifunctional orotidine-5'-phosphate decarboxylase/orotate phosphoribosyltransferase [Altericista sp. CCNU0014]|uniref:bifunctional orotidine-5'-phosphate decarboxylase/orotate phosphoribosyltransferase n=1 Tax=Altericista sp. CCNU0014 TaxID=3082949 RepID=UPI00384DE530